MQNGTAAVFVVAALVGGCSGASTASSESTTRQIVGSAPSSRAADQEILDQLQRVGADLTKPRNVRHHLFFHDAMTASSISEKLASSGFRTSVAAAQDGSGDWGVTAEQVMIVNLRTIAPIEAHLRLVASDAGGTYDGWEAAAKP